MSDRIVLRDLQIMAICGALPEEKVRVQPFRFDIEVEADLIKAGQTDDLGDTIDYGQLTADIAAMVESTEFTLLEHMSQRVADVVLANPMALAVTVEVQKMRPPVPNLLGTSGVRITRSR